MSFVIESLSTRPGTLGYIRASGGDYEVMRSRPLGVNRHGQMLCAAGESLGKDFITADPATGTITRGKRRRAQVQPLDGVTASVEGVGRGLAGMYLVIDGPRFQWRIRAHRPQHAHIFVENFTNWQRTRVSN